MVRFISRSAVDFLARTDTGPLVWRTIRPAVAVLVALVVMAGSFAAGATLIRICLWPFDVEEAEPGAIRLWLATIVGALLLSLLALRMAQMIKRYRLICLEHVCCGFGVVLTLLFAYLVRWR